jgi:hypothetical protein
MPHISIQRMLTERADFEKYKEETLQQFQVKMK